MSSDYQDGAAASERVRELLERIAVKLGLSVTVTVVETEDALEVSVEGEGLGVLIGRQGQTIDAIQHLAQRFAYHEAAGAKRVVVDADGYRERRQRDLRALADEAADEALRDDVSVELDPMPASERRFVHEYLRERGDVETHSEGDEPARCLVVSPPHGS